MIPNLGLMTTLVLVVYSLVALAAAVQVVIWMVALAKLSEHRVTAASLLIDRLTILVGIIGMAILLATDYQSAVVTPVLAVIVVFAGASVAMHFWWRRGVR